jgi:ATP-dependent Clp protease protease subunit
MNYQKDFDLFRKSQGISAITLQDYQKKGLNGIQTAAITAGHINPYVIEERQLNISQLDIFSRLMMDRIIFLGTVIDDTVSNIITAQLLFLSSIDANNPISMYYNSGGGGVHAGLAILDTMEFVKPEINSLVTGMSASMSFVLSISGKKRSALKHARLMQHQPSGGAQGTSSDMIITMQQMVLLRDELYTIIAEKTKHPFEKIKEDCEKGDYWMTSKEAKEYGALDDVIGEI